MKLIFLGVSSALSVGYKSFHANMLLELPSEQHLLIDCGGDIRHALFDLGYSSADIDAVYISHLHADHVGGLEWLGFSGLFLHKKRLPLYIGHDLVQRLWDSVLAGGMSSLENEEATLGTFFTPHPIGEKNFNWQNTNIRLVPVEHTYSNGVLQPSYGLMIYSAQQKIFITTDTRFSPAFLDHAYEEADIIFHDCELSIYRSNQHAHYDDLKNLPAHIKKKIWLYGYNNIELPDALADGFAGFVMRGQEFSFS